jgi:hypothetical protein
VNYINKQTNAHDFVTLRNDFLNDKKGQRTGVAGRVSEWTVAYNHWIGTTIQFRPELRFDHTWDRPMFNYAAKRSQFTAATDVVFHF